jgi:ATP-dependent Lon protease
MAAHRHGILEAIIPRENEKDLPDIPDAIKKTMKLSFVDSMDEVLKIALERELVALPMPPGMPGSDVQQVEERRAH